MSPRAASAVEPPGTEELNYNLLPPEPTEEYLEKEKRSDDWWIEYAADLDEFLKKVS